MINRYKSKFFQLFKNMGYTVVPNVSYDDLTKQLFHFKDEMEKALQKSTDARLKYESLKSDYDRIAEVERQKILASDSSLLMASEHLRLFRESTGNEFLEIFEKCNPHSQTGMHRLFSLHEAVKHLSRDKIDGDIVECGVWKGGAMMMVAHTLLQAGDTSRNLYLYDTFEGHPEPDPIEDFDIQGNSAANEWRGQGGDVETNTSNWSRAEIEVVQENMRSTGYPEEKLRFVKGQVENTLGSDAPDKISLLRLDLDWYKPTVCALETLYPRLASGGVLILDDYGSYKGCKKAVDEYLNGSLLLNVVDYSCRIAIKP